MTTSDKQIDDKTVLDFIRPYAKIQNLHSYHLRNLVRDVLRHCRDELTAAREAELAELRRQRDGYCHHLRECEQIAGKALGYPWFKDDQKNFPGATEADGVCVGEHVGDTIVSELANKLTKLTASDWVEAAAEEIVPQVCFTGNYADPGMVKAAIALRESDVRKCVEIITKCRDAASKVPCEVSGEFTCTITGTKHRDAAK